MIDIKFALTAAVIFGMGWLMANALKPDHVHAESFKIGAGFFLLVGIILFIASVIVAIWIRIP